LQGFYCARAVPVHASYYTDPACPVSWSAEPAVRRIAVEFGDSVSWTHVMVGIREIGPALQVVSAWLDAADRSGMPVDPRLWLDGPSTSYPACMAVKAAEEQGGRPGADYLRALREGFAVRRKRLDHLDALVEVARGVDGVDAERFRSDAASHAIVEKFGEDLERSRAGERALPSIDFRGEDGQEHGVEGPATYEELRAAAVAAGAEPAGSWPLSIDEALRRYRALATVEVAMLCDLPGPRAPAELWRLAQEWRVRPEPALTGELWTAA
jgi:predicted DsbA family dithiol-disulfide isomerase